MEFTNEFVIPRDIDESLAVLTDLEQVAPCFPGATLESVDGDTYTGRVKVKVGPMSLTYTGDATVTEVDEDAHTARIEASGREKRGAGTASADVGAELEEVEDGTKVVVTTDINITGKPAQFGRGVMDDIGAKIIDRFAENLRDQLSDDAGDDGAADDAGADTDADQVEDDDAPGAAASSSGAAVSSAGGTTTSPGDGQRRLEEVAPRDDALDLMDVAGEATAKRLVPWAIGAAVLLVLWLILRDTDDDGDQDAPDQDE